MGNIILIFNNTAISNLFVLFQPCLFLFQRNSYGKVKKQVSSKACRLCFVHTSTCKLRVSVAPATWSLSISTLPKDTEEMKGDRSKISLSSPISSVPHCCQLNTNVANWYTEHTRSKTQPLPTRDHSPSRQGRERGEEEREAQKGEATCSRSRRRSVAETRT